MEVEPSQEFAQFKESYEILPPVDGGKTLKKFRIVTVDTSKRYRDEERPILVEEFDTSVRSADWTERRTLMTLYRARSRVLRSNLKGHLANELLIDVDKFYVDETKPLGLPEYWPNNGRRAPGNYDRIITSLKREEFWGDLKVKAEPKKKVEEVQAKEEGEEEGGSSEGGEGEKITEGKD
jgi:hypothetical protein